MANNYELYLRDFVPSVPLPMITIPREDLAGCFPIIAEYVVKGGHTYVRYPKLFGSDSILSRVWFQIRCLTSVTNHFLYCLEILLNSQAIDPRGMDEYPDTNGYYVQGTSFPISLYPLGNDGIGIK